VFQEQDFKIEEGKRGKTAHDSIFLQKPKFIHSCLYTQPRNSYSITHLFIEHLPCCKHRVNHHEYKAEGSLETPTPVVLITKLFFFYERMKQTQFPTLTTFKLVEKEVVIK
jgi:hypothetical protein